jgi:hypothetical protein
MKTTILSISAAPGWFALFKQEDGSVERWPLACWALVENKREQRDVVGLVSDRDTSTLDNADASTNFAGYRHESDTDS